MNTAAYLLCGFGTAGVLALRAVGAAPALTFGTSAATILGLAYAIGQATEHLGRAAGPRIAGVLNATVGNIGEIIIACFLIEAGELDVVHASITGSIVGNLLLVVGLSLLVGGAKNGVQRFDARITGMNASSLILAAIGLVVPATFAHLIGATPETGPGQRGFVRVEELTIGVALLLFVAYVAHTVYFVRSPSGPPAPDEGPAPWSRGRAIAVLLAAAAAMTAVSEILVASMAPAIEALGWSRLFVGIILIPLIGNLAEHVVGVTLAYKNQMDFSLLTSLGSATQIALFAVPVLVFFAVLVGHPLTLVFTPLEVVAVAASVVIVSYIALDGRSNWVEGLQLTSVYCILALAFFFLT